MTRDLPALAIRLALVAFAILSLVIAAVLILNANRANRVRAEQAEASAEALRRDQPARDRAAEERLADALTINANRETLRDAVQALPDARPSDRRVALACARLRQQGTRPADLPALCGSGDPAQAGAVP